MAPNWKRPLDVVASAGFAEPAGAAKLKPDEAAICDELVAPPKTAPVPNPAAAGAGASLPELVAPEPNTDDGVLRPNDAVPLPNTGVRLSNKINS